MDTLKTSRIAWSLLSALAILASAVVFKGNPASEWVQTGLLGMALVFVVLKPQRPGCLR